MNNINITAVFEPCDEGGYMAYIQEIEGINSQGKTIEEAKENLSDAVNMVFEELRLNTANRTQKSITQTISFTL